VAALVLALGVLGAVVVLLVAAGTLRRSRLAKDKEPPR
jgi:hypothetical protein